MNLQDELSIRGGVLRELEKDVGEALRIFCCRAWQASSGFMRDKYPLYALDPEEFRQVNVEYKDRVHEGAFSVEQLVLSLLQPLVRIHVILEEQGNEKQISGRILRWSSYAGCLLGLEATYGDLETELRILYSRKAWCNCTIKPSDILAVYKKGEIKYVAMFINERLRASSEKIIVLNRTNKDGDPVFHAPPLWRYADRKFPLIDEEILSTGYHLYASLAQLIEQKRGEV